MSLAGIIKINQKTDLWFTDTKKQHKQHKKHKQHHSSHLNYILDKQWILPLLLLKFMKKMKDSYFKIEFYDKSIEQYM